MILEIKKLSKNFGGVKAICGCSVNIEKEKITAIIGPNGSGKSTLFNVISGLEKSSEGDIFFNKNHINKTKDFNVAKLGLSRTFQEVRLFSNLTIKDHLEIALSEVDESLFSSVFGKKKDYSRKIREALSLVGLDKESDTLATDLSYGQRKLLDLSVALAKPHLLLMLDEPVAGINPELRKKIKKILIELRKKKETVLLIEHDMNFVMDLADYVYVLDQGKVIAHGTPDKVQKNKKVLEAYLGE